MKYAVQLYSLREYGEKHGLRAILEMVARTGYDGVEFAGYYGHTPEQVAEMLKELNLTAVSTHVGPDAYRADFAGEVAYLKALEIRLPVVPCSSREQLCDGTMAAQLAWARTELEKDGIGLGYHNHYQELDTDVDYLERLTREIPGLKLELDVFWACVAGKDPVALMKQYGERLALLHIKELGSEGARGVNPVPGEGIVGMPAVIAQAEKQEIPWLILEVERYPVPEEDYLKRSIEAMKKMSRDS